MLLSKVLEDRTR
uniref:Uncharacterized protein n=1 Tax=Rhizophora mucronata TaxID=61149 RepID=A0A2P2MR27_RHIMU